MRLVPKAGGQADGVPPTIELVEIAQILDNSGT
jgi:hypothetical protein